MIFLAFPIGMVPFTHATSFFFVSEWAAQFFTVFVNIFVMMIIPTAVYIMQGI